MAVGKPGLRSLQLSNQEWGQSHRIRSWWPKGQLGNFGHLRRVKRLLEERRRHKFKVGPHRELCKIPQPCNKKDLQGVFGPKRLEVRRQAAVIVARVRRERAAFWWSSTRAVSAI